MNIKALPEVSLKRFLYLSREEPRYISGDPETHGCYTKTKLLSCEDLLKTNKNDLTVIRNVFEFVNNDKLLTRRAPILFALAVCVTSENISDGVRHEFYTLVLNLCKSDDDFFNFIKFCTKERKSFPSGLSKIISAYYLKKEPLELARSMSLVNSYHGWKHKDIIKLSHCKTDSVVGEAILAYVLHGMDKARSVANDNEKANEVLNYMSKVKEFKASRDEQRVAELLSELKISHVSQIPSSLNKSQLVWEALIPHLPLSELISCLPKLYKYSFLKQSLNVQTKVIKALTDAELTKNSKIHPAEVFIGLRTLEKGGKPKDPKLIKYLESKEEVEIKSVDPEYKKPNFAHQDPAKCPSIISALHKTLNTSYTNLRSTGRRMMVTINVGSKMCEPCLTTRNVNALEAAVLVAFCLSKVEKNLVLAVFKGSGVRPISLEKCVTLHQAIKKVKEWKNETVTLSAPFQWAITENKPIDIFINIFGTLSKDILTGEKLEETVNTYKNTLNLPNTRVITCCLGMHNVIIGGGKPNWLDICGFDKDVPKIIEAYIRDLF